ncbi:putative flagellum transition zone component [Leptomonas seymouri]|uniref:Putative flagellum transition zone component n=1 Tax=Leptomonas seymouri TaxID=5684 RepID=A0A0N0P9B4_LEPSE|nr:putative flagellum transition zone component [Leptomonas seymouri]|eukprot:KPI90517.1 putative flagellum transition zone component [Leptomonas seymouri]
MSVPDCAASHECGDSAVYVRSPLTAAESDAQYLPGSRFLNATEFKRIYLGSGEGESAGQPSLNAGTVAAVASLQRHTSPLLAQRDAVTSKRMMSRIESSGSAAPRCFAYNKPVSLVPCRPPPSSATILPRAQKGRTVRMLYSNAGGNAHKVESPFSKKSSRCPQVTRNSARETLDPNSLCREESNAAVPSLLSQQLRCRVRAARRSPSISAAADAAHAAAEHASGRGLRTEDAWLSLHRELTDRKEEVRALQRQLRHAQVLVRTLHGLPNEETDGEDEGNWSRDADAESKEGDGNVDGKKTKDLGSSSAAEHHPKGYWQRRAYFLEKQQEKLTLEVEQLRRDARASKVRALVKELEVARKQLSRYRPQNQRPPAPATSRRTGDGAENDTVGVDSEKEENTGTEDDCAITSGLGANRWPNDHGFPGAVGATAADEVFLRQKDDLIRDLRERLRLLTVQYQKADAQVIASSRQLDDLTHRYTAMQTEWRGLRRLPQELAQVQQQLNSTQARLLDSDREVEAFRQLFDTLESPATLRAVMDEREHLVELLRQSQQQQAGLRDEMKASQQQAVRAVEAKYLAQREEEHALARDREAQQEQTIRRLRRQVETLKQQLGAQRETYEAELAENAGERVAVLTERLLESAAYSGREASGEDPSGNNIGCTSAGPFNNNKLLPSEQSVDVSRSASHSALATPWQTSRDGQRSAPGDGTAAAVAVVDSLEGSSTLLDTPSSEHNLVGAVLQKKYASSLPPQGGLKDASGTPVEKKAARPLSAHAGSDNSSLTPMSDTISSTVDTLTDIEEDEICNEEKESVMDGPLTVSYTVLGSPLPNAPSKEIFAGAAPHDDGHNSGNSAALAVHQELASNEEALDNSATASQDSSSSISSSSRSSTAQDDEVMQDETAEKMEGLASDLSSDPVTPPRTRGEMRIGFSFPRPHDPAATPAAEKRTSSTSRCVHVFDFPVPPIAIVHPVSILINRSTMGSPQFASDVRAVVYSPQTSTQQSITVTSDPTHSQPLLTESESESPRRGEDDDDDEEEESSSNSNSSSSSTSSSASLPAATPLAPAQEAQKTKWQPVTTEGIVGLKEVEENGKNVVSLREATGSSASTIHSGPQSTLADSLENMLAIPNTDAPPLAHLTQLPAPAIRTTEAPDSAPSLAPPDQLSALAVHSTAHMSMLSLQDSTANLTGAMSNKAAPGLSPPAATPFMNSSLYPPRINGGYPLPILNLDERAVGGGAPRGDFSPRRQSTDHGSFELVQQFSGNASFDFVGPLAERHRLEDLQNNIFLSQQNSPATLSSGAVGVASLFPSAAAGVNTSRTSVAADAAGAHKTSPSSLGSEARQQSSTASNGPNSSSQNATTGGALEKNESPASVESNVKENEEHTEQQLLKSMPAAPVLAVAASEHLGVSTQSACEAEGLSIDGPSQSEVQARTPLVTASNADQMDEEKVSMVELPPPIASSTSDKSSGANPSPTPEVLRQGQTLLSISMDDANAFKDAAADAGEAGASGVLPASSFDPPASSPLAEHARQTFELQASELSTKGESVKPAEAVMKSPAPAATLSPTGAPLVPSSLMAMVPTPPSVVVPLPPRVAVPQPPSFLSAPLSPPSQQCGAMASRGSNVANAPTAAVVSAVRAPEGVLSSPSTPEEVRRLSSADMKEMEGDVDDDSFSFAPPTVKDGTVEKKSSPPGPRPLRGFFLSAPRCEPPPPPESTTSGSPE